MNSWLLFAILGPILWGCANVFDSAARRHYVKNDLAMTWYLALTRLPIVIILFLIAGPALPPLPAALKMLATGFFWVVPFLFYYKALEREEPSRVVLLIQPIPIFVFLIAFLFLGEHLSLYQGIAFMLVFLGGICAALKKIEGVWHFSKVFWIMMAASVMWACADVLFKYLEPQFANFFTAFAFFFFGSLIFAIFLPFFGGGYRKTVQHFRGLPGRAWFILAMSPCIGVFGTIAFFYALTIGKASLTTVLQALQPLAVFIFGLIMAPLLFEVYKEEVHKQAMILKIASFILIGVGLFFLQQ